VKRPKMLSYRESIRWLVGNTDVGWSAESDDEPSLPLEAAIVGDIYGREPMQVRADVRRAAEEAEVAP
jgi:hypothetical protein